MYWGDEARFCAQLRKPLVIAVKLLDLYADVPQSYQNGKPRLLLTSDDKLHYMQKMLKGLKANNESSNPMTVYIGDSNTDIECLTSVDVGIIMSPNTDSKLMRTFQRFDTAVRNIRYYRHTQDNQRTLWWAASFEEITNSSILR